MIKIDQSLLDNLVQEADLSERKRKNFNFHASYEEPINRMLNAFQKGTYVQPHKHEHPDKVEVFIILTGKAAVVEFDDNGNLTDYIILEAGTGNFGIEIPPRTWHTVISLENGTVLYELKEGPYSPLNDKNFATWAPREGDTSCKVFNDRILFQIGYLKNVEKEND